jgi:hypothetical protein
VLDRLMMACANGKNAETILGPGGLGALTEHKLWMEAAEGIARLDAVHRDAQHVFLNTWKRVGYLLRGYVGDDDVFFAMLRKLLPAYDGPAQTLYRGQRKGEAPQPSWTRSEHIACNCGQGYNGGVRPRRQSREHGFAVMTVARVFIAHGTDDVARLWTRRPLKNRT